jgi:RimJ/RimL family protein N-acetyltransferase
MSQFQFRSQSILLRAFESVDTPQLQAYLNDPDLVGRRYVPDGFSDLVPLSTRQVEAIVEQWQKETESWTLAIADANTGELVGHVRADWEWDPHCPSVCVVLAPAGRHRGYGSAALGLAVGYLFLETPAHVVSGWVASWNDPALAFAARNRFRQAGRRPCAAMHGGVFTSDVAFDLLRSEWETAGRRLHGA